MLPLGFFVIHNSTRSCQDNVAVKKKRNINKTIKENLQFLVYYNFANFVAQMALHGLSHTGINQAKQFFPILWIYRSPPTLLTINRCIKINKYINVEKTVIDSKVFPIHNLNFNCSLTHECHRTALFPTSYYNASQTVLPCSLAEKKLTIFQLK